MKQVLQVRRYSYEWKSRAISNRVENMQIFSKYTLCGELFNLVYF